MSDKLNSLEIAVVTFAFIGVAVGVIGANISVDWFEEIYAVEDGIIENLTLVPLFVIIVVGITYIKNLRFIRSKLFVIIISLSVLFAAFVIGEEISWGQRVFNVESSAFFLENNAQQETNLHNLVVGGQKINKIVFSQLIIVCLAFYLILLPWLYHKKPKWQQFIDYAGIPLPRTYQIIACLVLFISISFIPSGKNAEILEFGITHLFALIYVFPKNKHIFRKKNRFQQSSSSQVHNKVA
ncbi:hypothetical protein H8S90_15930 [Olivibacter sp. SDN3]|uniref:hypothetical protein n=1 Tax=Olivibacter sp. SDN3 TaxID=2764720 RepID=UPI0016513392|nr:hypothetical protein [Olivibacter sp. SDN3]QNL48281.1 hypothetical protein H8S90_15930 [Olivibacter sp. SDN3]